MNDRPTLAELIALRVIAAHGSFTRAAGELELSQSTLSHMMRTLEARLGVRLLNRTTRSVSPTNAGERLIGRLASILGALDDALAEIDDAREQPNGTLRITASDTVVSQLVLTVVPEFLRRYPEVTLDLVANPEFIDIVADGFDAGIRLGEAVPMDMIAVRFGRPARMLAVGSPGYFRDHPKPRTPDDLIHHACIRSRTPAGRAYRWEFERQGLPLNISVPGKLVLNRTEHMVAAALQGFGIAFVPKLLVRQHLVDGSLVPVLTEWCPEYPGLFLYYPGRRHVPASLKAFIECLRTAPLYPEFPKVAKTVD